MTGFYAVSHDDLANSVFLTRNRALTRWEAYCWLLDKAAFAPSVVTFRSKQILLARGQYAFTLDGLAISWSWAKSGVRRFLEAMAAAGFLEVSEAIQAGTSPGTSPGTPIRVITLCKYDAITLQETDTGTSPGTSPGTLIEEGKNLTKEERKYPPTAGGAPQGELMGAKVIKLRGPHAGLEQEAYDAWNAVARDLGFATARSLTPQRRARIRARLTECGGLAGWAVAMQKVRESEFFRSGPNGWTPDLDFILQPKSFVRLMEDCYLRLRSAKSDRFDRLADSLMGDADERALGSGAA